MDSRAQRIVIAFVLLLAAAVLAVAGPGNCLLAGIVGIVLGVLMFVFRGPVTKVTLDSQERFWGFHYDERVRKRTERFVVPFLSGGFVAIGLLAFVPPCRK